MPVAQFFYSLIYFILGTFQGLPNVAKLGLMLGFSLLIWRVVKFTLLPFFRPNEPQEYPYWLPGVGHLFSFFQNSDKLLARGR